MADVSVIEPGRWGFSRIVAADDGGWTTYAMEQQLAASIMAKYPPLVNGSYAAPWALVRGVGNLVSPPDGNTVLIPRDLTNAELTLGDLTAGQRNDLRNFLETWVAYQFTDWDGSLRDIPGMLDQVSTYTAATLVREVLRDCYRYLAHSSSRPRPITGELHNTEYTDDFSVDSTASWTIHPACVTEVYDAANGEMDFDGDNNVGCYYANNAGSIEHEAQITGTISVSRALGPGVRMYNGAEYTGYGITLDQFGNVQFWRYNAGVRTAINTVDIGTPAVNDYVTQRYAAEGVDGANVLLSYWYMNHGASKPGADPGWIGANLSPDISYTDTSVDRCDDGTVHINQGVMGRGNVGGDSNSDWFKLRALSDRVSIGTVGYIRERVPLRPNVFAPGLGR